MNLLITGAWQGAKDRLAGIEAMGHRVCFLQQERDALPCDPSWVEGIVCNGLFLHHPMEQFPNLRFVQLTSAGFDRVPMACAAARNITVCNARDVYSIPMADHVLGAVLQLYRKFADFRESQKQHRWEKRRDLTELAGKTVCILGCGSVGSECAKRFEAFGCRVEGIASEARQQPFFSRVRPVEALEEVLPEADILVLALPLTDSTRYIMNAARIGGMKQGAILVNVARGAAADTQALTEALKTGKLAGAVLDVFEEEPLGADSPLWDLDQVIITPHNSFVGDGTRRRLDDRILENLKNR